MASEVRLEIRFRKILCAMGVSGALRTFFILSSLSLLPAYGMHLKGTWSSGNFFIFLGKFGFQKTNMHDKVNTQGYIYGNITSTDNITTDLTFVVVDSEYFLEFYGNRTALPRSTACPAMFTKVDTIAWDRTCNPIATGTEDFLRKIPCPHGGLCVDEETDDEVAPGTLVPGYQLTYVVQDTSQPR